MAPSLVVSVPAGALQPVKGGYYVAREVDPYNRKTSVVLYQPDGTPVDLNPWLASLRLRLTVNPLQHFYQLALDWDREVFPFNPPAYEPFQPLPFQPIPADPNQIWCTNCQALPTITAAEVYLAVRGR